MRDNLSHFAWRVLRALHARVNREAMIEEYSAVLVAVEQDEPHLTPLALR